MLNPRLQKLLKHALTIFSILSRNSPCGMRMPFTCPAQVEGMHIWSAVYKWPSWTSIGSLPSCFSLKLKRNTTGFLGSSCRFRKGLYSRAHFGFTDTTKAAFHPHSRRNKLRLHQFHKLLQCHMQQRAQRWASNSPRHLRESPGNFFAKEAPPKDAQS